MSVIVFKKRNATAEDAVKLAQVTAWKEKNSNAVSWFLKQVPFRSTLAWFEEMFWLIDSKIEYRYDDPGREQIKTPNRLSSDGAGDCDDYATLWLSILQRVGVVAQPKIVDYENDGYWDHIYVIVPVKGGDPVVLDNVVGKFRRKFNSEVDYKDEKIFRPLKF